MQAKAQWRKIDKLTYPLLIDVFKAELEIELDRYIGDVSRQHVCAYLKRLVSELESVYQGKKSLDNKKEVDTPTNSF